MICQQTTQGGKPCKMPALKGSKFCFTHNPQASQARTAARMLGGFNSATPHAGKPESVNTSPRSIPEVLTILDYTLAETMAADNGTQRNRALVAIVAEYVGALKVGEIETQLKELLAILASRKES